MEVILKNIFSVTKSEGEMKSVPNAYSSRVRYIHANDHREVMYHDLPPAMF